MVMKVMVMIMMMVLIMAERHVSDDDSDDGDNVMLDTIFTKSSFNLSKKPGHYIVECCVSDSIEVASQSFQYQLRGNVGWLNAGNISTIFT